MKTSEAMREGFSYFFSDLFLTFSKKLNTTTKIAKGLKRKEGKTIKKIF